MTPNGMHLCPGCAPPVFYPNFIPNADESDFERCHIVPEWVRSMRQFKPKRIPSEVVGVIKRRGRAGEGALPILLCVGDFGLGCVRGEVGGEAPD